MTIEENIFKRAEINKNALAQCGFRQANECWTLERPFMNGDFKAVISVDSAGHFSGSVYEIATQDEYLPLRVESMDGFAGEVRNEYEKILLDIKNHCWQINLFIHPQSNRLTHWIKDTFCDEPEFPWDKFDGYGVFKNPQNNKWYALVMNIKAQKLDKKKEGEVEVVNIKLESNKIQDLLKQKGFYPAYHMNKKNWITILLNDTVSDKQLFELVNESHAYTVLKGKK